MFRNEMIAELKPVGAMELILAERVVSLAWRLKRAVIYQDCVTDALIERSIYHAPGWNYELSAKAKDKMKEGDVSMALGIAIEHDFAESKTLDLLLTYECRIENRMHKALSQLKKMQEQRRTREKEAAKTTKYTFAESSESHPHPDENIQDEAATQSKGSA